MSREDTTGKTTSENMSLLGLRVLLCALCVLLLAKTLNGESFKDIPGQMEIIEEPSGESYEKRMRFAPNYVKRMRFAPHYEKRMRFAPSYEKRMRFAPSYEKRMRFAPNYKRSSIYT